MTHFWHLLQKHGDEFRTIASFVSPVATTIAATVATGITWRLGRSQVRIADAQRVINATQRDIAERKFRHDMHAKRYELYRATMEMVGTALSATDDAREEFPRIALRVSEGRFFFPDRVWHEVNETAITATLLLSLRDRESDEHRAARAKLLQQLVSLTLLFHKEMSFRDIDAIEPS